MAANVFSISDVCVLKWVCVCVFQNDQQLDCALDLMRRLPPQQIEKNLSDLIDLVSHAEAQHITAQYTQR